MNAESKRMALYMREADSYMDRLLAPLSEHLTTLSMVYVHGSTAERAYQDAKAYRPPRDYGDWRNHYEWLRSIGRTVVESIVETEETMRERLEADKAARFTRWLCENFNGRVNVSWPGNDTLKLVREDGESVSIRLK